VQAILPVTVPMHQSVTIVVFQGELATHVSYFVFEELLPCVPHKANSPHPHGCDVGKKLLHRMKGQI
jgi:hypothetical protein